MPQYRDEGIVLRTQRLGEADRIVTVLTKNNGRVRAVAKGVRKTTSRFGARVEPFGHIDAHFHLGKSLDILSQVESLFSYGAILSQDYAKWTAGQAMLETTEHLTPEEKEPATQQYLLLIGALRSLVKGEHDPNLILDSFLLRSLAISGYAPSFYDCARCDKSGPHKAFSVATGGAVCDECKPSGSVVPSLATFELMSALLIGDWIVADASEPKARREASGIIAAYLQWHIERGIRSLRMVERK
ncbi:MAG: DNA repair protein RecO [Actinomycetes bacterium]|jgi:DNA repair protein RecO (recombination protein O)